MVQIDPQRILLIGDTDRQMYAAVTQAIPGARVKAVENVFDGIAELAAGQQANEHYSAVLAAAEPVERRPDVAVRTLRDLSGQTRLLLFGHPTLEPLAQKMLEFGCDDYLVTPASPGEILQVLTAYKPPRDSHNQSPAPAAAPATGVPSHESPQITTAAPFLRTSRFEEIRSGLKLAEITAAALADDPSHSAESFILRLNKHLAEAIVLSLHKGPSQPALPESKKATFERILSAANEAKTLRMECERGEDPAACQALLDDLEPLVSRLFLLQERHLGLQKMAITDDLTGVYNGRYLRHFLTRIVETARSKRFPVTLFLFDIDNFKKYNDQFGHGVGDEILKQTAALMKRCCRDHDLVARISGDEFAVVFWEKEGPRQPREPRLPASRSASEPQLILERFRRLLATQDFPGLGAGGQGTLTISGGLAVYPYDAGTVQALIDAADRELMFGAKRAGRNCIQLVGGGSLKMSDELPPAPTPRAPPTPEQGTDTAID